VAQSVPLEELESLGFFPKDQRNMGEAFTPEDGKDALGITITRHKVAGIADDRPPGILVQTSMLFTREFHNLGRDTGALVARYGITVVLGLLIGIIFYQVGETDPTVPSNIQSRFGGLIMVLMMNMFGTATPALQAFPAERPVFLREYSTNHYSVVSYFVSRFTVEAVLTALQVLVSVSFYYVPPNTVELYLCIFSHSHVVLSNPATRHVLAHWLRRLVPHLLGGCIRLGYGQYCSRCLARMLG
jgi:hypothetical protein